MLATIALLAAAGTGAGATTEPESQQAPVEEVVVTAPEPRFVAPTTRDSIGRIWAPVLIDGKGPFRLVLDTGASRSALIPRVVERLGLPVTPNGARVRGVTGSAVVPTVQIRSLEFGELLVENVTLPVVADVFGGADGVLGGDGLHDMRVVIEFRRDRISIARSRKQAAPGDFSVVPFRYVRAQGLRTQVLVGPVPTLAIIDTGGQATVGNLALRKALARRRGEKDPFDDAVIGVTEDVQPATRVRVPSIVAGELIVRRAEIRFADLHIFEHWNLISRPALLIGMDVLGRLDTLILDYRREEMQVKTRP
ncbi:MAG TPA: aspartyl protease family protein [Steroidobacteraceae bacterium]|nr:aspartyl protease family protein [Steroidobacteraceae bacterium]